MSVKYLKFENHFNFDKNLIPLVVVDCRVQVFNIMPRVSDWIKKFDSILQDYPDKKQGLVDTLSYAYWLKILNNPISWLTPKPEGGYKVVVVDDFKYSSNGTYWRSKYVPEYKANRDTNSRPDLYYSIYGQFNKYMRNKNCTIPVLRQEGFEADDFAGKLAQIDYPGQTIFLTVDSDWKQLVDDKKRRFFANSKPNDYRLQSDFEVLRTYYEQGFYLKSPKEISKVKHLHGDESDNLAPGSPIGVIDLFDPIETPEIDDNTILSLKNNVSNTQTRLASLGESTIIQMNTEQVLVNQFLA